MKKKKKKLSSIFTFKKIGDLSLIFNKSIEKDLNLKAGSFRKSSVSSHKQKTMRLYNTLLSYKSEDLG